MNASDVLGPRPDAASAAPSAAEGRPPVPPPHAPADHVPGQAIAFERDLRREMGFSLGLAALAFLSAFAPFLVAALVAREWQTGVVAWAVGGGAGVLAFVVGLPLGRRAARARDHPLTAKFLGAVLGLAAVGAGALLLL